MAVRFSGAGQDYVSPLLSGTVSQFSVALWVKINVDRNKASGALTILGGTGQSYNLITSNDGTTMIFYDDLVVGDFTGFPMTVGTWYFVGISVDSGNGTFTSRAMGSTTWSTHTWTGSRASLSQTVLVVGGGAGSQDWLNGCLTAVKFWAGSALTEQQLQNESWTFMPQVSAPTTWYPLLAPETTDYSGNAFTLSGTGATLEAGPGIAWRQRRVTPPIRDTIELVVDQATTTETAQPVQVAHEVGQAVATELARATGTVYTVEVNTVTESDIPIEILDPIAIGVTPLTASAAAASAQSWSTASVAPGSQRLVLLCVAWAASTAVVASPIASVTGCGLTWVLVLGQNYGAATGTTNARHRMEVWRALGTAPTAGAITVTHAASQPGIGRCWSVFEMFSTDLSGTNGSGAIRQSASNRSTAASALTATLGAFGSTSNATVGFGAGGNVMTVGTPDFVAITAQRSASTPDVSLISEWFLGADTTVNVNQTTPTDQMGVIGIEIKRRIVEPLLPGPVTEVDTAQAVTRVKRKAVAQATQTNAAQAVTARRIKVFAIATSTETAQPVARPVLTGAVGQVTLTNTAQPISARKVKLIGQATSSQAAQAVTGARVYGVAQAAGTELARPFTAIKVKAVAQAIGAGTAQAISARKLLLVGQASSSELAQVTSPRKVQALGQVTETGAASIVGRLRVLQVAQAAETMLARLIGRAVGIARALTTETARALVQLRAVLQTVEPQLAKDIVPRQALTAAVGQVADVGAARPVSVLKGLAVGQASSTDQARILVRAPYVGRAAETAEARPVAGLGGLVAPPSAIALSGSLSVLTALGSFEALFLTGAPPSSVMAGSTGDPTLTGSRSDVALVGSR